MRNWLLTTEAVPLDLYKDVPIHARPGVHEEALALLRRHAPPPSRVLDVGAGAGAFSRRLADAGYEVTALDVDPDKWMTHDIPFVRLDVSEGIARSVEGHFAAACCLEVIEHVENPWNLLREIASVVRPGGKLVLSTPNVSSFLSRAMFLRRGVFHQFGEDDLAYGHIRPITANEISVAARRTGWRILETHPAGYLPLFDLSTRNLRGLAFNVLRGLAFAIASGHKRGWALLFIMESATG